VALSLPLCASPTLFPGHESARQALMTQNVPKIQSAAKQEAVAAKAETLAKARR
jgi:hypothetical protein